MRETIRVLCQIQVYDQWFWTVFCWPITPPPLPFFATVSPRCCPTLIPDSIFNWICFSTNFFVFVYRISVWGKKWKSFAVIGREPFSCGKNRKLFRFCIQAKCVQSHKRVLSCCFQWIECESFGFILEFCTSFTLRISLPLLWYMQCMRETRNLRVVENCMVVDVWRGFFVCLFCSHCFPWFARKSMKRQRAHTKVVNHFFPEKILVSFRWIRMTHS